MNGTHTSFCNVCGRNSHLRKFCHLCKFLVTVDDEKFTTTTKGVPHRVLIFNYIERLLNEHYFDQDIQINNVVIYPRYEGGFGDIIFGYKTYNLIKSQVTPNVIIYTDDKTAKFFEALDINIPIFTSNIPEFYQNADINLLTPTTKLYTQRKIKGKFNIEIHEYVGFRHKDSLRESFESRCGYRTDAGLSFDSIGIFIEKDTSRFNKFNNLSFLRFFNTYLSSSKLFFGYVSQYNMSSSYIQLILQFHNHGYYGNINNIAICTRYHDDDVIDINWKNQNFIKYASDNGYNIRIIFDYKLYPNNSYESFNPNNTKTLTILNVKGILYEDVQHLLYLSDPFVFITGDQSLSDAISLNKRFIYEALGHKRELYNSLYVLVDLLNLSQIKQLWLTLLPPTYISKFILPNIIDNTYLQTVYNLIYNHTEFNVLNSFIRENFDIETNLIGMMKRFKTYFNNPEQIHHDYDFIIDLLQGIDLSEYTIQIIQNYFEFITLIFDKCKTGQELPDNFPQTQFYNQMMRPYKDLLYV